VSSARPLGGILVVSMEQAVSAPIATRHLADMGARVVKVERPDGGDFARHFDTLASGLGTHFTWVNRNKESLTLDVKKPGGEAVLSDLLERADVFVQNLAPGAARRAGIDGDTLLARFPRLIVCEISGYGSDGPFAERHAYDLLIQCEAAIATITGSIEAPVKPGIAVADIAAGMYAYSSVLAALIARGRTGRGSVLEVSMFDAAAEWMGYALTAVKHGSTPVFAAGLSHPAVAPYDAFVTSEGDRVVLGVQNDREWARLAAKVIGRPDLATDPRFATNAARVRHRDELHELIGGALAPLAVEAAIELLSAAGIACARVNTVEQVVNHPQLVERHRWHTIDSPVGQIPTLLPPVISSAWEPALGAVPALGEHTDALLAELGRDEREIAALHDAGTV
jgi:itaconate CoA-transferase